MKPTRFDLFVAVWNRRQDMNTPELHIKIARWLEHCWKSDQQELLLLAFRNSGKSTLVGLFSAWLLLNNPDLRILVIAADLILARKMVRNVKRIIERHPLTPVLIPSRADQWASDRFTVNRQTEHRDPSMQARGIGANVTGSRADIIICDDVEVPNTSDSPAKRQDLRQRLEEVGFVLVPGGTRLYIGTPHTLDSLYVKKPPPGSASQMAFLEGYTRLELPLLDAQGNSRWPQQFPPERIEKLRLRSGPNKFQSQMMLQPVNLSEGRLDPGKLTYYQHELDFREANQQSQLFIGQRQMVSASCWWDPSYGSPTRGDASVIAALFSDAQGDYWLHRVAYLTHDPALNDQVDEATQQCRQVVEFLKHLNLPALKVETNGLGRFLPGLLRRELSRCHFKASVIEVSSSRNKALRIIEAFDAVLAAKRLHVHRSVLASPFVSEMGEWRVGSKGGDDGLDAVAGCLLSEPIRLPKFYRSSAAPDKPDWRPGQQPLKAKSKFEVWNASRD